MHPILASGIANTDGIELLILGLPLLLLIFLMLVGLLSVARRVARASHTWWQNHHVSASADSNR